MIIDTSALLAILYGEEDAERFVRAIATAPVCRISAANFLEAAINIDSRGGAEASRQLDFFIRQTGIEVADVTAAQAQIARQAYQDFGKGRHKAGLNLGDCFAYALARETGESLLFKGNDFIYTDSTNYTTE
ncbi:MAG: type II toxin-antitoxin system VapC family toxin [Caldilineaceae bacterium]|nr:type II toxin-antitoxin system VapC family toxin [Caldilineaceae bacterium]HRJ43238.1 type II toxin-antitoxin system VapC family toxin [Caldilineaceae bacterium]